MRRITVSRRNVIGVVRSAASVQDGSTVALILIEREGTRLLITPQASAATLYCDGHRRAVCFDKWWDLKTEQVHTMAPRRILQSDPLLLPARCHH